MKTSVRVLAAAAVIVLVAGLVARFPARVAAHWFLPDTVQVSGVNGTLWSGDANALAIPGLTLTRVQWKLRPWSLFTGALAADLEASPAGGFIQTRVSAGLSGSIRLSDLTASIPLVILAEAARTPGLGGTANLRFEKLNLRDGLPVSAKGSIDIGDMRIEPVYPGIIGDFRLEFGDINNGVVASIEDIDAVLDVAGTLTLRDNRSYQLLAQLAALRSTPAELKQQIEFLPRGNAPGQREIRLEGAL